MNPRYLLLPILLPATLLGCLVRLTWDLALALRAAWVHGWRRFR